MAPKLGFLPRIIGIFSIVISGLIVIDSYMRYKKGHKENYVLDEIDFKKLTKIILISIMYILIINKLGFVISSVLFLVSMFIITGVENKITILVISLSISIGFYIVFKILLDVSLPMGIMPI